jgi:PAS domain S-box-containing protein
VSRPAWRRALIVGSAVALGVAALAWRPPAMLEQLDARITDLLRGPSTPAAASARVGVVDIDERSLAEIGRWPWPRTQLARLLAAVRAQGAEVIAVGMMFPESEAPESDRLLSEALRAGPFVIGYAFTFDDPPARAGQCLMRPVRAALSPPATDAPRAGGFFRASGVVCNTEPIDASAPSVGFLNATADRDGLFRRVPVLIEYEGQLQPSLPLAAVLATRASPSLVVVSRRGGALSLQLGPHAVPLDARGNLLVHFRARNHFPTVSAADVLTGRLPAGTTLRDRVVVVGISALGVQRPLATPVDPQVPAAELHATIIENLLQGDALYRPSWGPALEVALAGALALGIAALLVWPRSAVGILVASLGALGLWAALWAACAWALRRRGLILSPLYPSLAVCGSFVVVTALDVALERRRAEHVVRHLVEVWRRLLHAVTSLRTVRRQRRRLARALRASEARYQHLFEDTPIGLYHTAPDGQLVDANAALVRILRYPSREALLGVNLGAVDLDAQELAERGDSPAAPETPQPEERRWRGADGAVVWLKVVEHALRDPRGRLLGRQGAVEDVTEHRRAKETRERLEHQLREAQKMEALGRLAGGVAHDFNNLLTVIAGGAQLVLTGSVPPQSVHNQIEEIHEAARRAAELTKQLLAFSRRQALQPQVLDLNRVLREVQRVVGRLLREDITLEVVCGEGLRQIRADPSQLQQIILNLVVNARDAMPMGGRLALATRNVELDADFAARHPGIQPGSYVALSVQDTGVGMDADTAANCFEPFFTTKELGHGTGLGLSTVYGIVQQHEGCIDVVSAPKEGTTFSIYLPSVTAAPDVKRPPVVLPSGGWERILLVEDEPLVRSVTRDMLLAMGFSVVVADSGPAALRLVDAERPRVDLLLTDVIMPGLSGRDVAREVRARYPDVRVVYMSGYTDDILERHQLSGGGVPVVLEKPFTVEALLRAVRAALEAPAGKVT